MSEVDNILVPDKKEVVVGEEKFEISALVRAKYGKLIKVFAEMLLNMDQEILENAEDNVADFIAVLSDEALIELYKVVLDKSEDWINNNMTLPQEVKLFEIILEVNDADSIIRNFTQVLQRTKMLKLKEKMTQ